MAQFQHYIPQFLLKNFTHLSEKGKNKGSSVLYAADIDSTDTRILEVPVKRWFGLKDMYEDISQAIASQKTVETKLGALERHAARIINKVKETLKAGGSEVVLSRTEVNHLHKFLFIMKYRGPGFYEKYFGEGDRAYDDADKHLLQDYMHDKHIATPREVWLHNLHAILDVKMDVDASWMKSIATSMFPSDADMFLQDATMSYLTFCTPAASLDEFILTDHCYAIGEGPTFETVYTMTGENWGNLHISYYQFGIVAPKLAIILRSILLPEASEDKNPVVKEMRKRELEFAQAALPEKADKRSILEDLPVSKPLSSMIEIVNGVVHPAGGQDGTPRSKDQFRFRFSKIQTKHVDIINALMLDNIADSDSIVFRSRDAFRRTLEAYMLDEKHGFKQHSFVGRRARRSPAICLQRLYRVLTDLGSRITPVYSQLQASRIRSSWSPDEVWVTRVKKDATSTHFYSLVSAHSQFWETYHRLGGCDEYFPIDLEQSWKWQKFHRTIFKLIATEAQSIRSRVALNLIVLMSQQSPRRVWMFLKHHRWIMSQKYAMLRKKFIGIEPIYVAKTRMFFSPAEEDKIVVENVDSMPSAELCMRIYEIALDINLEGTI